LIAVFGSREITAGIEPARRNGKVATLTVGLGHDVSTVLGIGRQLGSPPLHAMGRLVEDLGGRYIIADDVGTTLADLVVMRAVTRYTAAATAVARILCIFCP
jgi:hypothetical protein